MKHVQKIICCTRYNKWLYGSKSHCKNLTQSVHQNVYELVKTHTYVLSHNGTVSLESNPDSKTTYRVRMY